MFQTDSSNALTAAVLIIGNEILSGRTPDTNTAWIAQKLSAQGVELTEARVIPDEEGAIIKAVNELRAANKYVFTTGGLGPTHDDITADCIAKAFGRKIGINAEARKVLDAHYGAGQVTPEREKMAYIPDGAQLIHNPVSGAPGFVIENVYVMAGIPRIMQAMLENVLPTLGAGKPILSNTIVSSLGESVIAKSLGELQKKYPQVNIGSYPHYRGGVGSVSLVLRAIEEGPLSKATEELVDMIRKLGDEPQAVGLQAEIGNL